VHKKKINQKEKQVKNKLNIPTDGIQGLKEYWKDDLSSGFMVALLALPLSLGIAAACDFPNPLFGVLSAIIGGVVVSLFMGAKLTIKGPAAGLIVIVAGSVSAMGGAEIGWQLTAGAIVIAALVQMGFGLLKWGKLSDFFPLTAVHGMLAAIGIIIMSKQVHILMGVNPVNEAKKPLVEPLELVEAIPHTFHALLENSILQTSLLLGVVALIIVFVWPLLPQGWWKKIPMPLVVLLVTIPLGMMLGLTQENKQLVKVGKFWDVMGVHATWSGIPNVGSFVQYVFLFAVIGSLESLLTAKAVDMMDPFKRKTDFNRDLIAVGAGNALSGLLGGLPMISEVARSSSNVSNGAKTRWANFFHGVFLFVFVAFMSGIIEMIPKAALAALLIGVGYKLAHPKTFKHTFEIGKEQLLIFVVTIIVTLVTDLLIGIGAGIATEIFIALSFKSKLKIKLEVKNHGNDRIEVGVEGAALFLTYLKLKNRLEMIPNGKHLQINLSKCEVVDHTVMENLHGFEQDYRNLGGHCHIVGLDDHRSLSNHHLGYRVAKK
jgi:MFS superfamily sulfate permease-like transporter